MSKNKQNCIQCGKALKDGENVCPSCGAKQSDNTVQTPGTARNPRNYEEYAAENRSSHRKTWQFTVVLAVIVAIIIVAVILVLKMTEKTEPVTPSETYDTIHIISQDGEEITATAAPDAETVEKPAVVGEAAEEEDSVTFTETDETVLVASAGASLRNGASTTFEVIASLAKDTELHRTGVSDSGWSRVEYEGEVAYVSSSLVNPVETGIEETEPTEPAEPAEEKPETTETGTAQSITGVTAASGTVKVTSDANLRKGPGTGYEAVAVAKAGTELTLTGTIGGWDRIEYNGETLFISGSLVSSGTAASATSSSAGTVTVTQKANIRSGAGTGYDILGVVDTGTTLSYSGMSGTWYIVDYNGKTGYINRKMVSASGSTTTSSSGTLKVISDANIRSGAGTGYDVLGVADAGTTLTYSGMSGTWYIVDYNGQTGYVNRKMVQVN